MENLEKYGSYGEYKRELDQEMERAAESFVRIGYLLKVARDTNILWESGYETVAQFALAEYHLRPDQVTRFIQINDRFSEGGYSVRLQDRYTGMGYTKLVEMLQLPDEVNAELTPGYTREEIKEIREEIEEEQKISDIEVILEGSEKAEEESLIDALVRKLLHDDPELYRKLYPLIGTGSNEENARTARWEFAPAGECQYSVRLGRIGKFFISLKAEEEEAAIINLRTREKERYSWQEILDACSRQMISGVTPKESWERTYGEELEQDPESQKGKEAPENKEEPKKKEAPKKRVRNPAKEKAEKEKKARAEYEKHWKGVRGNENTDYNAGRDLDRTGKEYGGCAGGGQDAGKGREQGETAGDAGRNPGAEKNDTEDIRIGERAPESGAPDSQETGAPAGVPGGLQLPAGYSALPDGTEGPDEVQGADDAQARQASLFVSNAEPGVEEAGAAGRTDDEAGDSEGKMDAAAGATEKLEIESNAAAGEIAPAQQTRKKYLDGLTEYGAALYISRQYRNHELGWINMESVEELERWFSAMVDVLGNRI